MFYILPPGRSREGGASMPGRDQCPKQTGSDVRARGDLRGRGTQIEYDKGAKLKLNPKGRTGLPRGTKTALRGNNRPPIHEEENPRSQESTPRYPNTTPWVMKIA